MTNRIFRILAMLLVMTVALPLSAQKSSSRKLSPAQAESVVLMAVEAYDSSAFKKAEVLLDAVLLDYPDNDAAHFYMGMCKLMDRDADAAEAHLRKAVDLDPKNFWYRYRLAAFYSLTGQKEITVSMYESLLEDFPKKSELYYNLVDLYISQQRYDDALATLDNLDLVFGKTEATAMTRYDILMGTGRQEAALDSLKAFNAEYSSPEVLSALGDHEISCGRDSTALLFYDEAIALDPDYAPALLGRAETYRMTRRMDMFFPLITQFMAKEGIPTAGKTNYLTALTRGTDPRMQRNYRREFDGMFKAAMDSCPGDSAMLFTAGVYYLGSERKALADSCFKTNVNNYPDDERALATYCSFLSYVQDWDGLIETAETAYKRLPDQEYLLQYASMAAYRKGDYAKVIALNEQLAKTTDDPEVAIEAYSNVADMYQRTGDTKKAYKTYEKVLKMNPDYVPALNNYAYYLSLEGKKLRKAYAMSKKTVEAEPDNPTYLDTFGWILHLQGKDVEAKGVFKHAMLYGGKESATILDHYAEVLYALKEYNLAFIYWDQAMSKADAAEVEDLAARVKARREQIKK